MQTTDTVLMVRPINFSYNLQTAGNNAFQKKGFTENAQKMALKEYDCYVDELRKAGIKVISVEDTMEPPTPDSIFPNNWISTHTSDELMMSPFEFNSPFLLKGKYNRLPAYSKHIVVVYSMFAPNSRAERVKHVLLDLEKQCYIDSVQYSDLTGHELNDEFLEGTGPLILDRENKLIYACM